MYKHDIVEGHRSRDTFILLNENLSHNYPCPGPSLSDDGPINRPSYSYNAFCVTCMQVDCAATEKRHFSNA